MNATIGSPCSYGARTADHTAITGKAKTRGSQNSQAKPRLRRPHLPISSRMIMPPTTCRCTVKSRHSSRAARVMYYYSGPGVLTYAGDQQPDNAIRKKAGDGNRAEGGEPLRVKRVIRQIGSGYGLQKELLPLRFEPRRFERGEGRYQGLLPKQLLQIEPLVVGESGRHRIAVAGDFGAFLRHQFVERGKTGADQRDLRAVRRILQDLSELRLGAGQLRRQLAQDLQRPRRGALRVEHFLFDAVGGQLRLCLGDLLLGGVDLALEGRQGI